MTYGAWWGAPGSGKMRSTPKTKTKTKTAVLAQALASLHARTAPRVMLRHACTRGGGLGEHKHCTIVVPRSGNFLEKPGAEKSESGGGAHVIP